MLVDNINKPIYWSGPCVYVCVYCPPFRLIGFFTQSLNAIGANMQILQTDGQIDEQLH